MAVPSGIVFLTKVTSYRPDPNRWDQTFLYRNKQA